MVATTGRWTLVAAIVVSLMPWAALAQGRAHPAQAIETADDVCEPATAPSSTFTLDLVRIRANTATSPNIPNGRIFVRGVFDASEYGDALLDTLRSGLVVSLSGAGLDAVETLEFPQLRCFQASPTHIRCVGSRGEVANFWRKRKVPLLYKVEMTATQRSFDGPMSSLPVRVVLSNSGVDRHVALRTCQVFASSLASCRPAARAADEVDALLASAGVTADTPGGAVMVIREGCVVHSAGYGLADVKHRAANTPHTVFRIASITKTFTALAIMMLAEEGRLRYDDPIGTYLPELARFGDGVTIRRLLYHTAGLPDYANQPSAKAHILELWPMPLNTDELTFLADRGTLKFPPGDLFAYSNTGYEMLAVVIERLSGQSYGDFLEQRVFRPLGMNSTFSLPNAARLANPARARGYRIEGNIALLTDSDPFDDIAGAYSIYSTVEDLARYDQALYTNQLVSQATLAEGFAPGRLNDGSEVPFTISPDPDDSYAFGWIVGPHRGERYVSHAGTWPGWRAFFLRMPARQLTVALLLNRETPADSGSLPAFVSLAFSIADLYLPPVGE